MESKNDRPDNHLLWRETKEDDNIPFINFQTSNPEKEKKALKKWEPSEDFEGNLVLMNMSEMQTSRKVLYCKKGHEMTLSSVRGYRSSWSCDNCGAGHGPEPGFKWYWCDKESGGCDYCPNCYPKLEKTLVKKGYEAADPLTFETKQVVFWKTGGNYVQIKGLDNKAGHYICRVMNIAKND